jgi:hypothetical protein
LPLFTFFSVRFVLAVWYYFVFYLNTTCYISEAGSACSSIISLYGSCFSVFALLCSVLLTVVLSVCPCLPLSHIQHIINEDVIRENDQHETNDEIR